MVEGQHPHEVLAEGVAGEALEDGLDVALQAADHVLDVGGIEPEDDEDVIEAGLELLLLDEAVDELLQPCEVREEGASADEDLVLQAGNLRDLVDEVDDREGHLDDLDVELGKHALELTHTQGQEVHRL